MDLSKINIQRLIDTNSFCKFGNIGDYSSLETLTAIRRAIKNNLNVELSNSEAHEFWRWHSMSLDASFLNTEPDKFILKEFKEYVEYLLEDFDNEEDYYKGAENSIPYDK